MKTEMKRLVCCLVLLFLGYGSVAQKLYFVYIESETKQPFFVKLGEKTYQADASGYIIIPKLKDSTYQLTIGFSQDTKSAGDFPIVIRQKDRGFLLKNFGDKGWGLFDMQTLSVQMAEPAKGPAAKTGQQQVSLFTQILSKAANDPSLTDKPAVAAAVEDKPPAQPIASVKQETNAQPQVQESDAGAKGNEKTDPVKLLASAPKADSSNSLLADAGKKKVDDTGKEERNDAGSADSSNTNPTNNKTAEPVVNTKVDEPAAKTVATGVPYRRSVVTKKSESSTTEGFGLVFIDEISGSEKDTVRIMIPNPVNSFAINTDRPAEKNTKEIGTNQNTVTREKVPRNCLASASDNDFLKLRKKMASQKSDEAMINESRKTFRSKCFTTLQVKNLGSLFLSEAAKFQFYEAAYPFSSDRDNFASLLGEFKDAYFVHRFKNLIN